MLPSVFPQDPGVSMVRRGVLALWSIDLSMARDLRRISPPMKLVGIVAGILLWHTQPSFVLSQEAGQSDGDVLRLLREAISRYSSVNLHASARTEFPIGRGKMGVSTIDLGVKRSGSRSLMSIRELVDRPGAEVWRLQQEFLAYENGDILQCQAKLDSSLKQIDKTNGLSIVLHSKKLAGIQERDRTSMSFALNDVAAALWFIGYMPLLEYLDNAPTIEVTLGENGAVVHSASEYGKLTLTASRDSGWLPASFELVKEPEHKTAGGLVADVYENSVTRVTWTGGAKDFTTDSEGRWAPARMDVHRRTEWRKEPVETIDTAIEIERITFDPQLADSDFQISIVAPVGYAVNIRGAEHLPYKWDGQAAIPGIPDIPPRPAGVPYENLRQMGRSNRTLTVLIAINALLISVLLLVVWRTGVTSR